jgi:hypothetical protein
LPKVSATTSGILIVSRNCDGCGVVFCSVAEAHEVRPSGDFAFGEKQKCESSKVGYSFNVSLALVDITTHHDYLLVIVWENVMFKICDAFVIGAQIREERTCGDKEKRSEPSGRSSIQGERIGDGWRNSRRKTLLAECELDSLRFAQACDHVERPREL